MSHEPLDWRRIEAALVKAAQGYGFFVFDDHDTGEKLVELAEDDHLSLTELAHDLEKDLGPC